MSETTQTLTHLSTTKQSFDHNRKDRSKKTLSRSAHLSGSPSLRIELSPSSRSLKIIEKDCISMLYTFLATIGGERREKRRTWGGRGRFRGVMSCRRKLGKSRGATPGSFARAGAPGGVFLIATPMCAVWPTVIIIDSPSFLVALFRGCSSFLWSCSHRVIVRSLSSRNTYAVLCAAVACKV